VIQPAAEAAAADDQRVVHLGLDQDSGLLAMRLVSRSRLPCVPIGYEFKGRSFGIHGLITVGFTVS